MMSLVIPIFVRGGEEGFNEFLGVLKKRESPDFRSQRLASLHYMFDVPGGDRGDNLQSFIQAGSALRSIPLPFYLPF